MKSVAIITKKFKPDALEAGRALKTWLEGRGVKACHFENEPDPHDPAFAGRRGVHRGDGG